MNQLYIFDPVPENQFPVILLHGLGSDHTSWKFQVPDLINDGFRPIAVDIPGFGKSDFQFYPWTIRKATRIVIDELIDKFSGKVIIVGLSMGGVIAQSIFHFRPEKIEKLILVSTFSRLRPSRGKNLSYLIRRITQISLGNLQQQAKTVSDRIFPDDSQKLLHDYLYSQISRANPIVYRQCMISLGVFNSSEWMRRCKIPTLIISGGNDTTVTLDNQIRLAKTIPNSKHIIIPGGGHAVSVDHAVEFNFCLLNFIKK